MVFFTYSALLTNGKKTSLLLNNDLYSMNHVLNTFYLSVLYCSFIFTNLIMIIIFWFVLFYRWLDWRSRLIWPKDKLNDGGDTVEHRYAWIFVYPFVPYRLERSWGDCDQIWGSKAVLGEVKSGAGEGDFHVPCCIDGEEVWWWIEVEVKEEEMGKMLEYPYGRVWMKPLSPL